MNENIDLTKILKDCPKGWKFYSSVYGEVEFIEIYNPVLCKIRPREDEWLGQEIYNSKHPILFRANGFEHRVSSRGEMIKGCGECTFFPSRDQRDWSKFTAPWYKEEEKLVKPKFKVGDRVRRKGTNKDNVYEITKVYDESYGIAGLSLVIKMEYQDLYELVPNKFDPKTLNPFDRVLVRNYKTTKWRCEHFSHFDGGNYNPYIASCCSYTFCIPYNDDTKHLVGTTEEAPEFYRYWED